MLIRNPINETHTTEPVNLSENSVCKLLLETRTAYDQFAISYGMKNLEYTEITEIEIDTPDKLAMDIMSSLGFWLGFSIVTVIEMTYFCGQVIFKIGSEIKNKSRVQNSR